ncbi:hypothetical protein EZS27_037355 [termite gut metagenome]|uniref:Uncharacterized protein n=1 Tax=termite gut metagenome TaxID=433724 RepID=A0A5J4PPT1_9ZZZZ
MTDYQPFMKRAIEEEISELEDTRDDGFLSSPNVTHNLVSRAKLAGLHDGFMVVRGKIGISLASQLITPLEKDTEKLRANPENSRN